MKRIFIVTVVCLLTLSLSAQEIGGGLEIGTNYSWFGINSKAASSVKGRMGFNFGAFGDYNITESFAFSVGVNLLINGGTVEFDNPTVFNWDDQDYPLPNKTEVSYKMQHIEIPFSIKGRTQEIGYMTYFARIGGNISIAHTVRADLENPLLSSLGLKEIEDLNIKKSINPFNVGWHVGAGVEYSMGAATSLISELVFCQNFLSIGRDKVTDPFKKVGIKPYYIALKVGVKF